MLLFTIVARWMRHRKIESSAKYFIFSTCCEEFHSRNETECRLIKKINLNAHVAIFRQLNGIMIFSEYVDYLNNCICSLLCIYMIFNNPQLFFLWCTCWTVDSDQEYTYILFMGLEMCHLMHYTLPKPQSILQNLIYFCVKCKFVSVFNYCWICAIISEGGLL